MPYWENPLFRLEIEEIVGNENSLDLGSSVSVTRRFQVRQVTKGNDRDFEPIPYALANLIFYDYVMRFERFFVDLPFKQIRFVEDKDKIGEIFDAEVVYSLDAEVRDEEGQREFTLPTFSLMGGKKKQLLPVFTFDEDGKSINEITQSVKIKPGETVVEADKRIVNYKMLGWDGKKFNGTEIETSDIKFMIPAWYPAKAITIDFEFITRFADYIGAVNTKNFYGFLPGEVKYLGPEQSWVTRTIETGNPNSPVEMVRVIELQHQFHAQLEQKNVKIGDITVSKIRGWDFVDVHYEESMVDIGDGKKVPLAVPCQVDVVPVHKEKDLWGLFNGEILEGLWEGPSL